MEIQICFGDDPNNEEPIMPKTGADLEAMFEGKINNINVDIDDWCVLAVDHDATYRNTDKEGGGYIKFYPHCKTVSGSKKDQKVFRIFPDIDKNGNAIYTVHDGMGKGSDTITSDECKMFVAASMFVVDVKDKGEMTLFDMLNNDLKTDTDSEYTIPDKNGKPQKTIKVSTKNIKERAKGTKYEKFLNIKYDGKRKL